MSFKLFEGFPEADASGEWFKVYKLPFDTFAIYEPYHFQENLAYLIIGGDRALLWDTGMGIFDIKQVVKKLTRLPVTVLNSHCHFDHVGGNHLFGDVRAFDWPTSLARLRRGYSAEEMAPQAKDRLFEKGFTCPGWHILPCDPKPVHDGDVIDIGGRKLRVIHTPGHSPDSVMLADDVNRVLFTGDTYYPGHMYCHYEGDYYGNSDMAAYAVTMDKLSAMIKNFDVLRPSHNGPAVDPSAIPKVAAALHRLLDGDVPAATRLSGDLSLASLPDEGETAPGYVTPKDLMVYDFEDFKIIAADCSKNKS